MAAAPPAAAPVPIGSRLRLEVLVRAGSSAQAIATSASVAALLAKRSAGPEPKGVQASDRPVQPTKNSAASVGRLQRESDELSRAGASSARGSPSSSSSAAPIGSRI